eukprot:GDKK01009960.1.p1 GENE.GDKK01009960.1~~GDKK01009960.1.p1  ORF type:complete len:109 (+),score=19.84 GDKK01009960.1:165-491(+)
MENQQRGQVEKELRAEIEGLSQQGQSSVEMYKAEMLKKVDEAKYEMFQHLMDAFEQERKILEKAHNNTQSLLSQAAKDVLYLTQKNQELTQQLNQAIYYEPPLGHNAR